MGKLYRCGDGYQSYCRLYSNGLTIEATVKASVCLLIAKFQECRFPDEGAAHSVQNRNNDAV